MKIVKKIKAIKSIFNFVAKLTYTCKIVGTERCTRTNELSIFVLITGIKHQTIKYSPKNLITNDNLLKHFSPLDVRAITFYALQQIKENSAFIYRITGQEIKQGKTQFTLQDSQNHKIIKSAQELYREPQLLHFFRQNDLINIVSTAIQEQTIDDMEKIYCDDFQD